MEEGSQSPLCPPLRISSWINRFIFSTEPPFLSLSLFPSFSSFLTKRTHIFPWTKSRLATACYKSCAFPHLSCKATYCMCRLHLGPWEAKGTKPICWCLCCLLFYKVLCLWLRSFVFSANNHVSLTGKLIKACNPKRNSFGNKNWTPLETWFSGTRNKTWARLGDKRRLSGIQQQMSSLKWRVGRESGSPTIVLANKQSGVMV